MPLTEEYLSPLWISTMTVFTATIITFFTGLAVARCMARYSGRLKEIVDGVLILPIVLPPTVVGLGLLMLFGKNGPIGQLLLLAGATVVFSWPATVISAVVVSFPLMYMNARAAFEQVDVNYEHAASTLGAGPWRIFWTVTLPLAWPGVLAGTVLAFARALGEFGATLMLAGNIPGKTATIPIAIYSAVQAGNTDQVLIMVLIILMLSFASITALSFLRRRKLGSRECILESY
ncbi:MAG: molybdate ABC transporter permease subunit [Dehalococcoidia bacterium]|jgi:molybdate transport system permease protein